MEQQLKSYDSEGVQWAFDATSVSAFETCPRYYQLAYLQGWKPNYISEHLIFGGVYAAALERFHKLVAEGTEREQAIVEVVRLALVETWDHNRDENGNRVKGTGEAWNSLHNLKTRGNLIRTIVWYFDHFEEDPITVLTLESGKAAAELSFSLDFGDDLLWCGHLDAAVEYTGHPYVMDQKTSGTTITPRYFEQFNPNIQMGGYSWAGQQILGSPVKGVIIDAAQIAVGFTRFERSFIHYPTPLLNEWYDMTHLTIEDIRRSTREQEFRMNRTACSNYGGCQFRKVCQRIPEHRERVLRAEFKQAPRWDPLERR